MKASVSYTHLDVYKRQIWGYWNGLDEVLAREDRIHPHCRGINADQARDQGHITPDEYDACYENMTRLLASAGLESPQPVSYTHLPSPRRTDSNRQAALSGSTTVTMGRDSPNSPR